MVKRIYQKIVEVVSEVKISETTIQSEIKLECGHIIKVDSRKSDYVPAHKRSCEYCLHNFLIVENYEKMFETVPLN